MVLGNSINREGDTSRVNRNILAIHYIATEPQRIEEVTGDPPQKTGKIVKTGSVLQISGNAFMYLPQAVFTWFNIPTFDGELPEEGRTRRTLVRSHQRTIVTSALGAATEEIREITVIEFERRAAVSKGSKQKKRVKVRLNGLFTRKGKPRFITFAFPPYFNRQMIAQALATMFSNTTLDRRPMFFHPVESNAKYSIPYGITDDSVEDGWNTGAWVIADDILPPSQNVENPGGLINQGNSSSVSSSGDADGPAEA